MSTSTRSVVQSPRGRRAAWVRARRISVILFLALALPTRLADSADTRVEVWTRAAGDYGQSVKPQRQTPQSIVLELLPLDTVDRYDLQYRAQHRFRGLPLSRITARYRAATAMDTALLHFSNGMVVPHPLAASPTEPFIALEIWLPAAKRFTRQLPPARRDTEEWIDSRPVAFSGNKVVVSSGVHPAVPTALADGFSPWEHVATLVGIELVRGYAYERQFAGRASGTAAGHAVYRQACQFCHGVRGVGASHGWDFVDPYPAFLIKPSGRALYYHVRYQTADARARGLMMPAIKGLTLDQSAVLWRWLRAVANEPLKPYQP